jgi:hypothetical protein
MDIQEHARQDYELKEDKKNRKLGKEDERGTEGDMLPPAQRWFLARGFFYPEDGGDKFLRNVGSHKIYTAPHPCGRAGTKVTQ